MFAYTGQTISGKIENVKFLTNSPTLKNTSREANEILYILIPYNFFPQLTFVADVTFWDGSTSLNNGLHTLTTTTPGLYMVNASTRNSICSQPLSREVRRSSK